MIISRMFISEVFILTVISIMHITSAVVDWSEIYDDKDNINLCSVNMYEDQSISKRIFGGSYARPNEFPWLVSMRLSKSARENMYKPAPNELRNFTEDAVQNFRATTNSMKVSDLFEFYKTIGWISEYDITNTNEVIRDFFAKDSRVNSSTVLCAGSLISERWFLTARHCFTTFVAKNVELEKPESWSVTLGDHDQDIEEEGEVHPKIERIIFRSEDDIFEDIALVKLSEPVKFTEKIRPICLHNTTRDIPDTVECVTAGWGQIDRAKRPSRILKKMNTILYNHKICAKKFLPLLLLKGYAKTYNATTCSGERDADVCYGDSGGPIMCRPSENEKYELWSLVAIGIMCSGPYPTINTNILYFTNYIYNTIMEQKRIDALR